MTLSEYLRINELTATEFAARIGRSVSTVTRAARGEAIPDLSTMLAIKGMTDGQVQPNDFYRERGAA
jgi:transcriptional regulator with XRE-family HTH domain